MQPDDEFEIGSALRNAARRARGYADFFGWGPDRDLEEAGVLGSLAESLEVDGALFFGLIRSRGRGNDPPDLEAPDLFGRRTAFEITELVDPDAIRSYKNGNVHVSAQWTKEKFLRALGELLTAKNNRFPKLKDAPYEGGYVIVVFTDEPELPAPVVAAYLADHFSSGLRHIDRAYLVLSYDPRLGRCPYFEVKTGA